MTDHLTIAEKMRVYAATGASWTLDPATLAAMLRLMAATERKSHNADHMAEVAERFCRQGEKARSAAIAYFTLGGICFAASLLIWWGA